MLKYLVILLDDTSVSYCHYESGRHNNNLITLEKLKAGIMFAMKENITIQFVYPDYELPQTYKEVIRNVDHIDIVSSLCEDSVLRDNADIIVFDSWCGMDVYDFKEDRVYAIRTTKTDFFERYLFLQRPLAHATRINVVFTDVESFNDIDFEEYKKILTTLSNKIEILYKQGKAPQLNLLTDRMMLKEMNNCNAGWESITLAPDGKFYVCPAFYLADEDEDYGLGKSRFSIGDLKNGIRIKNPQLYKLSYAPICRNCDAFQCKRCVWLNRKMTYEINTPSHEQCVIGHLERNASRDLLHRIRIHGDFLSNTDIKEITYLDPFDIRKQWQE